MIVDDDPDILRILEYIFQKQEIQTISLEKGNACLEWLQANETALPDLIILDCHLPDISGLLVLEQIKKKFRNAPPVLILSALSQEENMVEAYKLGASEYITKPFVMSILIEKSLRLLSK